VPDPLASGKARRPRDPQRAERLLDSARRLFCERGFHGVSVNEIAEAAGTTGAAVYRHFPSKEDLLLTLLDDVQDRYLAELPPRYPDPFDELEALIDRHMDLTFANQELAAIWMHEQRLISDKHFRRYRRREHLYFDRWTQCLQRCFPEQSLKDCEIAGRAAVEMSTFLIANSTRTVTRQECDLVRSLLSTGLRSLGSAITQNPTPRGR
jgi:AcrR family transcriptional regulator